MTIKAVSDTKVSTFQEILIQEIRFNYPNYVFLSSSFEQANMIEVPLLIIAHHF